jgi:ZIP family zinc transporter
MTPYHFGFAMGLTVLAGLATGIGSLMVLLMRKTSNRFLSFSLGFSAGFMIYVSFVDILAQARADLVSHLGSRGSWLAPVAFFAGMILIAIIDRLVPTIENPHEARHFETMMTESGPVLACDPSSRLMRIGIMSALAIMIHNFPEGIATFTAATQRPSLGISIAVAIAIHNVPEGIAVAIPIYCATGNRRRAFRLSLLSGLSEPLGALVGFVILRPFLNEMTLGLLLAAVAGIMVYISLDELLPTAREYGSPHLAIYGLMTGMALMEVSLQLFT